MQFDLLFKRAIEIREKYNKLNAQKGQIVWDSAAMVQGLIGDVGDLTKLVMAKNNLRSVKAGSDLDTSIKHELSDCLWSIMTIAHSLGVNLEEEFLKTMDELDARIEKGDN